MTNPDPRIDNDVYFAVKVLENEIVIRICVCTDVTCRIAHVHVCMLHLLMHYTPCESDCCHVTSLILSKSHKRPRNGTEVKRE